MDFSVVLLVAGGLGLLVLGAELLVRGAARLAAAAGVSSLVIGLTVVAFGTSAPELAVSIKAAWIGQADLAAANVIGSNIFNVLFILGLSALVTPLMVAQILVRRDVPLMIVVSVLALAMAYDGRLGRLDGALLLLGLTTHIVWCVRTSRRETREVQSEYEAEFTPRGRRTWVVDGLLILSGLLLLVLGSRWLVQGAVDFARWAGVSEVVVGLTIIAAGTSLPEVATSLIAAVRGERDIAVGNVVGSNLFNVMGVLGFSAAVAPDGLIVRESLWTFDIPVMIAVAIACLPVFATGHRIARWEGGLFLAYYAAYVVYLVLDATQHVALAGYATIMLEFVVPLTTVTLGVLLVRAWRVSRRV